MIYECNHCGYITPHHYNFIRHQNRKIPCRRTIQDDQSNGQNDHDLGQNDHDLGQNDHDIERNIYQCKKCYKILSCKKRLISHENVCYGVDSKTCPRCFKVFSSVSGKNNHMRNVKCNPPPQTEQSASTINNITNNNITNNTTNNITNNIQINVFGKENLDYLLNDTNIILKLKSFGKGGIYAFAKILDDVHFNKDKPENTTLIKPDEFGNGVMIMNEDKEWEYRDFEDVRGDLLQTIVKYFRAYNEVKNKQEIKLVEKKEKEIIKNCAYELIALEGSIPINLFEELDMNDDDIEEDEDEIRKKIRKFDKSTMKNIHHRTSLNFKKENGSYVRK
tara:strand:+ start:20 stop:1021 length:1002 start_codon:yes stop_codon:yes gene_type:complete